MQYNLSFRFTYRRFGILLIIGLVLASCSLPPPVVTGQPPTDAPKVVDTPHTGFETSEAVAALMASLEKSGATVQWAGTVSQSFFTVPGWLIRVNGQEVEVYEYLEEAVRLADTARIAADGSLVGEMPVEGPGQPTFWADGKVIVLFQGDTSETPTLLSGVLGEPLTRFGAGTAPAIVLASTDASVAEAAPVEAAPPSPTLVPQAATEDTPVLPTNVTMVRAMKDVKIVVGPGAEYAVIGDLSAGNEAKVTGISADGNWWRVTCPDGSEGSCWVSGDTKQTKPAATQ